MQTTHSIYSDPLRSSVSRRRAARAAQEARAESRRSAVLRFGPPRNVDRLSGIEAALRAYRGGADTPPGDLSPMQALLLRSTQEVEELEAWVQTLPPCEPKSGPVIRQALDFLRGFGRLTALNFSAVPLQDRGFLVQWLAVEHRWCYAAAGTNRASFKQAAGRTGAR